MFSLQVSRSSTLKRALLMNHSVARLAEIREKLLQKPPEKCTMLYVLNAEKHVRFLLSQRKIDRFTAVNVLQRFRKLNRQNKLKNPPKNKSNTALTAVLFFYIGIVGDS